MNAGEYLLLCSDGLVNTVTDQEMLFEVIHGLSLIHICLSPSGSGNTEPGEAGHGPGAGDRADAPDDAAVLRLFWGRCV